ncbi:MAG: hypothetical protein JST75_13665 [Bacteroidetes bacterium]|nr:hypothetical protein [Bacteroidota bacterium]
MKQLMQRLLMKSITSCILMIASCFCFLTVNAQIPLLNSYPAAHATVYLDFNGQFVDGTIWNQRGSINANPASLSKNDINEIFERIADDYHPFNINITTDISVYEKAPVWQRMRIIFTPTNNWYGNSAGASCVGSFTWGDDTPAWVFINLLSNNPRFIASCASHQIGHTLGLQHQSIYDANCSKITEYNGGAGTINDGWAPIMGVAYYKNCAVWQTGPSAIGCDSLQSDADIIAGPANGFGFRTDDYGDDHTKSEIIKISGQTFSVKGMINRAGDKDAFKFNVDTRAELQLHVVPNNAFQKKYNESNIRISLLNAHADTIAVYEPTKLMYTGVDLVLDPGTYYFIVGDNEHCECRKPSFYAISGSITGMDRLKQFALNHSLQ